MLVPLNQDSDFFSFTLPSKRWRAGLERAGSSPDVLDAKQPRNTETDGIDQITAKSLKSYSLDQLMSDPESATGSCQGALRRSWAFCPVWRFVAAARCCLRLADLSFCSSLSLWLKNPPESERRGLPSGKLFIFQKRLSPRQASALVSPNISTGSKRLQATWRDQSKLPKSPLIVYGVCAD